MSHTRQFRAARKRLRRRRGVLAVVLTLALAGLASGAQANTAFKIIDLGTLGGASSWARAVNDSGQVVGHSYTGLSSPTKEL